MESIWWKIISFLALFVGFIALILAIVAEVRLLEVIWNTIRITAAAVEMTTYMAKIFCIYTKGSQRGGKLPPGVICDSSGLTRKQNHNVVLYYERSLQNKFSTWNASRIKNSGGCHQFFLRRKY